MFSKEKWTRYLFLIIQGRGIFKSISAPSQRAMKEKPRKRPSVPPNSATKDSREKSKDSRSTSMLGEVFHKIMSDLFFDPWNR